MGWTWLWLGLIVVGLLIIGYVVVRLVQDGRDSGPASYDRSATSARTILDERYACGEIDDEEYQRRKAALS